MRLNIAAKRESSASKAVNVVVLLVLFTDLALLLTGNNWTRPKELIRTTAKIELNLADEIDMESSFSNDVFLNAVFLARETVPLIDLVNTENGQFVSFQATLKESSKCLWSKILSWTNPSLIL
jgi:hypothetical protein